MTTAAVRSPTEGRHRSRRDAPVMSSGATRVLLAEDDPDVRNLLRHVLQAEGWFVEVCDDGQAALDHCLSSPPDLVVLDVMMPRLTGFEVLARLRAAGHTRLPVLILSARGSEADIVAGFDLGATDYVTKPFMIGELRARARALLARDTGH